VATAADRIYAHPTTVTGGIGVVINLYNLQDTMAQMNVFSRTIKSGEHIDMGSAAHPISPEAQQMLQAMADEFHRRFRWVVVRRRPKTEGDPTNFDGRVFTATEAQRRGLVDELGYIDDAVATAGGATRGGSVRVVMFHRGNDPARTPYAMTPNISPMDRWLPVSVPGLERSRLPTFLYLWGIEPTLDRISGGRCETQRQPGPAAVMGAVPPGPGRVLLRR
jgi:protease IV